MKFNFKGGEPWVGPFVDLLQGRQDEIILRQVEQLQYVSNAADAALAIHDCDKDKLQSMKKILGQKMDVLGTKVQIKPTFDAERKTCEKINIIVKWGGEFTHSGRYQSRDIAENMRNDMLIVNKLVYACKMVFIHSPRAQSLAQQYFSLFQLRVGLL